MEFNEPSPVEVDNEKLAEKIRIGDPKIFWLNFRETQDKHSKISQELSSDYGVSVTPQTIRNKLHEYDYCGRVPRKKPFINKINRKRRLDFAKEYVSKPSSFWETVIFSDESKFNVCGSDGRQKVWRKRNEAMKMKNIKPTFKHGGSNILVWGA
uniref:HTH_Tnp_Tc3_2 domain-containing protein n=1 Tax=Rhodnius prolixus TaxID=13249 RepID=T1HBX6_RHOPR